MPLHLPELSTRFGRSLLSATVLFSVAAILTACPFGSVLDNPAEQDAAHYQPPRDDCIDTLLPDRCGGSGCHGPDDQGIIEGGIDLVSPGVDARVVDQPARYPGLSGCPSPPELLVNSTNSAASLILSKVYDTAACGEGMPVPIGLVALKGEDLVCLENWVNRLAEQGAK